MMSEEEMLSLAAYVGLSSYRTRALSVLDDNEFMTPTNIAKNCDVHRNHISTTLAELKEKKLAICINEEARKGRLYKITELGHTIIRLVPKIKGE